MNKECLVGSVCRNWTISFQDYKKAKAKTLSNNKNQVNTF